MEATAPASAPSTTNTAVKQQPKPAKRRAESDEAACLLSSGWHGRRLMPLSDGGRPTPGSTTRARFAACSIRA